MEIQASGEQTAACRNYVRDPLELSIEFRLPHQKEGKKCLVIWLALNTQSSLVSIM
jgi:hypothetical protein